MRRKASITVFAALSLMLVAQLLFTLLEAARHYELQKVLYMNTDTVLESVFADYCSPLWETYKILGVRVDDTEGKLCFNNREAQLRGLTSDHLGSKEQKTLLSGMSLLTAEIADRSEWCRISEGCVYLYEKEYCLRDGKVRLQSL